MTINTYLAKLAAAGHSKTVPVAAANIKKHTEATGNAGTPFRFGRKLSLDARKRIAWQDAATTPPPRSP